VNSITDFVTDQTGVVASIVVILGIIAVVVGIVRPSLQRRRQLTEAVPHLEMSAAKLTGPPPHSEAAEISFELVNTGGGKAVLSDLLLEVTDHGTVEKPRMSAPAAPVQQFTYRVMLSPAIINYDIRHKEFGSDPPHSYESSEVESFLVELRSSEPRWYEFVLVARWYDARWPATVEEERSALLRVEFRPDVAELL